MNKKIIYIITAILSISIANALIFNESILFNPSDTYAWYNVSEQITNMTNGTVTSTSLTISNSDGTTIFSKSPTIDTYYQLRPITITVIDNETGLYVDGIDIAITDENGEVTTSLHNVTNTTTAVLIEATYPYTITIDDSLYEIATDTFEVNATDGQNVTIILYPSKLWLIFTNYTDVTVATETTILEYINVSEISIPQENISTGYVTVYYNEDANHNYQQILKYYNDQDIYLKSYILLEEVDLAQQFKVSSEGDPLEGARVCTQKVGENPDTNVTEWLTTYCDFTDSDGLVSILTSDQNLYKVCSTRDGYTPTCELHFLPPTNTNVILIQMEPTEVAESFNFIQSSCPPRVTNITSCTLNVITYKPYSSICFKYIVNGTELSTTCGYDSITESLSYVLGTSTLNVTIEVYLGGDYERYVYHEYGEYIEEQQIGLDQTPVGAESILEKISDSKTNLVAFYIIMLIIGIISGWLFEKYFNGYGVYGSGFWFIVLGIMGFYIFWIPAGLIVMYAMLKVLIPLIK